MTVVRIFCIGKRDYGRALRFFIREAKERHRPLFLGYSLLGLRSSRVLTAGVRWEKAECVTVPRTALPRPATALRLRLLQVLPPLGPCPQCCWSPLGQGAAGTPCSGTPNLVWLHGPVSKHLWDSISSFKQDK